SATTSAPRARAIKETRSNNRIAIDVVFIAVLFARNPSQTPGQNLFGRNSTGDMDRLSAFAAETIIARRPSQSEGKRCGERRGEEGRGDAETERRGELAGHAAR